MVQDIVLFFAHRLLEDTLTIPSHYVADAVWI